MRKDNLEGQTNTDLPIVDCADDDARLVGDLVREIMREIGGENLLRPLPAKEAATMRFGGDCGEAHDALLCEGS